MTQRALGSVARMGGIVAACLAAMVAVLSIRIVLQSRDDVQRAEQLRFEGHVPDALLYFRRAASGYSLWNPYAERAETALRELSATPASGEMRHGEPARRAQLALSAARSSRRALLGILPLRASSATQRAFQWPLLFVLGGWALWLVSCIQFFAARADSLRERLTVVRPWLARAAWGLGLFVLGLVMF